MVSTNQLHVINLLCLVPTTKSVIDLLAEYNASNKNDVSFEMVGVFFLIACYDYIASYFAGDPFG